jgi:ADP-ribose pyrophosphatase YjhB (NUDIX family)
MTEAVFCLKCGAKTTDAFRGGRTRKTCPACGWVFWRNPKTGVAVILRDKRDRVLLVRRKGAYEGSWCIPCGNIEADEDVGEAARREMKEETGLDVILGPVYAVLSNFHDPEDPSVGVWYLGTVTGGALRPGSDATRAEWFSPDDPPRPLAFPTDLRVLGALARGEPRVE